MTISPAFACCSLHWDDADGQPHEVVQAEGGEQGDPLMPALFALGQHGALLQAQSALEPGEDLFAFLDDVYVTYPTAARVGPAFAALGQGLHEQANIRVNLGKTRVWNAAGEPPQSLLDAWTGDQALPPASQGLVILGMGGTSSSSSI